LTLLAIANLKFTIDSMDMVLTQLTSPLANHVGEAGLAILDGNTPNVRQLRAKIALGRLHAFRDTLLTLKHDAAFWQGIIEILDAPVPAKPLVETSNDSMVHSSPEDEAA
jgi:hypothetical protein